MTDDYVQEMYCEIGRLKSGLVWIADEMTGALVLLSIGSMLAIGALAYVGSGMRATQWMSALAALWIASTGASAAAFLVGEGTLPCEVEFRSATDNGVEIATTLESPDAGTLAEVHSLDRRAGDGEGGDDGEEERPPARDPMAPHADEREIGASEWPETKRRLGAMGAGAQEAIWFGEQWMNERVTKGTRRVTMRTAGDGTTVLRGYHRAGGTDAETRWIIKDLDTDEMVVQSAGEEAPEAQEG